MVGPAGSIRAGEDDLACAAAWAAAPLFGPLPEFCTLTGAGCPIDEDCAMAGATPREAAKIGAATLTSERETEKIEGRKNGIGKDREICVKRDKSGP
ncbi:hypothetical protein GCM10011586_22650 [Silvibacterium dinghuense]|nr:hypothetical protein GCM10011586_22650 [Silvibacterium dinghuense]